MTLALDVRGLSKTYTKKAVDDLDLQVRAGELYALLGPNGAGKTTTLRMVAGLLKPDAGAISVFGVDVLADPIGAKRLIAWLPDEPMLYDKLTPLEYLQFVAGLWGVEPALARTRAEELLRLLDLWDVRTRKCEGLSRGMKQKAALAGALIHDPKLLILDEPLTGLDASVARLVKDLLQERVKAGATVILTTPHPRSGRAAGRPHRRDRRRQAPRRRHLGGAARRRRAGRRHPGGHLPPPGRTGVSLLGAFARLTGHEVRLIWRGATADRRSRIFLGLGAAFLVALIWLAGIPLGRFVQRMGVTATPVVVIGFDLGAVAIFTLLLSQTLAGAAAAFYERGDLDLLLSSPTPPGAVLGARAVGIALKPLLFFALLITPLVVPLAVLGAPGWLGGYGLLLALGLFAASAGVGLAMALFAVIGARATRTVGQLLAALIGAVFFLVGQARTLVPGASSVLADAITRWRAMGAFGPISPLSWPARAAMGEPGPLLALIGAAFTIFALVAFGLGRRFARDAALASGLPSGPVKADGRALSLRGFAIAPTAAVLRKELLLLMRDPTLLSQVLLRTLYVVPMTFVLFKNVSRHQGVGVALSAAALCFLAGQVAGSLAWITISAEDAPELLACAPVAPGTMRRGKLIAALGPVAVLLAAPLTALLILAPVAGAFATAGAAASAVSAGLVNLWFEKPAKRSAFRSRRGGSAVATLSELLLGAGWGAAAGLAVVGSPWSLLAAAATLIALGLLRAFAGPDALRRVAVS